MHVEGVPACLYAGRHTGGEGTFATVLGGFGCGPGALLEWADEDCLGGLQFLAQAFSTSVCTATAELPGGLSEAMWDWIRSSVSGACQAASTSESKTARS